jgi:hypothetical protein
VKQTASILLLTILAFNWVGYRFVSNILERKADLALETRIDNSDYDESSLIELRVKLNAPYMAGTSLSFERYDGEVEIDGVHYKYVKRKVVDGELVLLCIPNDNKTKILNSKVDFFKMVNDLNNPSQSKDKNTSGSKTFTTEYKQEDNTWTILGLNILQPQYCIAADSYFSSPYRNVPEQPPCA